MPNQGKALKIERHLCFYCRYMMPIHSIGYDDMAGMWLCKSEEQCTIRMRQTYNAQLAKGESNGQA